MRRAGRKPGSPHYRPQAVAANTKKGMAKTMFESYENEVVEMYSTKVQSIMHAFHSTATGYTGETRERLESRDCQNIFAGSMFTHTEVEKVLTCNATGEVKVTDREAFLRIPPAHHLQCIQAMESWARDWLAQAAARSIAL